MKNATLVFLIKRSDQNITEICLAMKKRGFGVNRWNGVGGKVEEIDSDFEAAARREAKEEVEVTAKDLIKMAELTFNFPHNPSWDQLVHVYFTETWDGEPKESDEMRPKWFSIKEIPYSNMWSDDIFWLPEVINGKKLTATFTFDESDLIQDKKINIVTSL